jgi:hypothetical protein
MAISCSMYIDGTVSMAFSNDELSDLVAFHTHMDIVLLVKSVRFDYVTFIPWIEHLVHILCNDLNIAHNGELLFT